MEIDIIDNSEKVKDEFKQACLRSLERCGMQGEGYAQDLVPVDTGNLRDSISHQVVESEMEVHIGSNSEYAIPVECGTGMYYPGGRQDPWVYQDAKGNWHMTHGQRAQPYVKPAVADHVQTYVNIIEDELHG